MLSKGKNPRYKAAPWFYPAVARRLRQEYPGVPPWQWDEHPDWLDRVWATLSAEDEADKALAESDT